MVFCEEGLGGKELPDEQALPPFRLRFVRSPAPAAAAGAAAAASYFSATTIVASPYSAAERAIVPELASNYRGVNSVAFTPVQAEAIFSALSPGLTLTQGKTKLGVAR